MIYKEIWGLGIESNPQSPINIFSLFKNLNTKFYKNKKYINSIKIVNIKRNEYHTIFI